MAFGSAFLQCTNKRRSGIPPSPDEEAMTSDMTAFAIAVGGTSLICYVLMTRLQNRRVNRRSSGEHSTSDSSSYAGGDGWALASWFGSSHYASDHSVTDSSGNPSDGGGGDSGGGGDGDGGDGGGGGSD
jgi:hypothetical protein